MTEGEAEKLRQSMLPCEGDHDPEVEQGWPPVVADDLKTEIDRRCDELDRNLDAVVSWQAVEERARRRFG